MYCIIKITVTPYSLFHKLELLVVMGDHSAARNS